MTIWFSSLGPGHREPATAASWERSPAKSAPHERRKINRSRPPLTETHHGPGPGLGCEVPSLWLSTDRRLTRSHRACAWSSPKAAVLSSQPSLSLSWRSATLCLTAAEVLHGRCLCSDNVLADGHFSILRRQMLLRLSSRLAAPLSVTTLTGSPSRWMCPRIGEIHPLWRKPRHACR